jgi:thioredoxin reductase (NADPH)
MEYGCVGLSEEAAVEKYGKENIEVYHSHFQALEHALPKRDMNKCYVKLVCLKPENVRIFF